MSQIDFSYNGIITAIQCNLNEKFKDIINRYALKTENDINLLYFLYSGQKIENYELTINEISNNIDKERKRMNIQICKIKGENNITDNNNIKIKSNQIICPECGEDIRIECSDYKIKPSIIINKNYFENTKLINNGDIVLYEINNELIDKLPIIINYIKCKGYNIVNLEKLIKE